MHCNALFASSNWWMCEIQGFPCMGKDAVVGKFISGDEEWKVEVCQDNEKHCFQMVGHTPWGGHG